MKKAAVLFIGLFGRGDDDTISFPLKKMF